MIIDAQDYNSLYEMYVFDTTTLQLCGFSNELLRRLRRLSRAGLCSSYRGYWRATQAGQRLVEFVDDTKQPIGKDWELETKSVLVHTQDIEGGTSE